MITKEDVFNAIADAWWERKPKIVEFVNKHLTVEGARIFTPEHTYFAGYRNGLTPPMYTTYMMRRRDLGCRVGMTRTHVNSRGQTVVTTVMGTAWCRTGARKYGDSTNTQVRGCT